jgi:beta-lactam-binding protein with PASTA domain
LRTSGRVDTKRVKDRALAKKKKSSKSKGNGPSKAWFILLILLLGGTGAYLYLKPTRVVVPDLVGMTRLEAETVLKGMQLQVVLRKEMSDDPSVKADQVIKQTPKAQTEVPVGGVVTLYIADTPAGLVIPDVKGKTRSEAEDVLRRLGLEVEFKEESSNKVEIGKVVSQDPLAGPSSLVKGDAVTLVISGGRGEQTVPELAELSLDFARQRLKDLGLEMVVMEVAQSGFSAGDPVTVLRQEPVAGTKLPVGSRVTVFIPIPPPRVDRPNDPTSTTVHAPRLEGLTVAQARELAATEGVVLELVEEPEDSSVITFQDPPPGDPLPEDDPSVVVRTVKSAVVPGLAGLTESDARAEVEKAELTVGSIKKSYGPVAGEVLGQRPSAGIEVLAGSSVDLVLADPSLAPDSAQNPNPTPTPAFTPAPWVE